MSVSGQTLKSITGLTQMTWQDMDSVSQGMIDDFANYSEDPEVEARCNDFKAAIAAHIGYRISNGLNDDDMSLIDIQQRAGLSDAQLRANVKLAIFGGQNKPKDTIAVILWAILEKHTVLKALQAGTLGYPEVLKNLPVGFHRFGCRLAGLQNPTITIALTLSKMPACF